MKLITLFLLLLTFCILTNSSLSLAYATLGLELWFRNMIPALLPFMILSGIMVSLGLTEKISMVLYPVLGPVYRVRKNVVYCILLGFLCGFPMGAKVTADLLKRELLTREEGEYLLAFCNNIGPVYFCSFVLPLLGRRLVLPYLFGMYGIPLLYGLLLRYTFFRNRLYTEGEAKRSARRTELICCQQNPTVPLRENASLRLLAAADESIRSALIGILTLGGYMILFNLFQLLPHLLFRRDPVLTAPLLEITGGLSRLGGRLPLYSLLALSFGGLSCIAQTYSCIRDTGLSIGRYITHKALLTLLNVCFYLFWFLLSPSTFLL